MTKLHPPIPGFTGRVGVQYAKEYDQNLTTTTPDSRLKTDTNGYSSF